jgi:hypothetical protein
MAGAACYEAYRDRLWAARPALKSA